MKYLAIYCVPQECGEPFVHIVSLKDGQIVKTYDIPEGYYDSGIKVFRENEPFGDVITRKTDTNRLPKIGDIDEHRRHQKMVLVDITDVEEEEFADTIWFKANLHYRRVRERLCKRFCASEDTFRKRMEEQGIDMTGWCVYKRRKFNVEDFLKSVIPYDIVNFIRC